MLTDRPAADAPDRPYTFAAATTDGVKRSLIVLTTAEATEYLLILGDMLAKLNPVPTLTEARHYATWSGGCTVAGCVVPSHHVRHDDGDVFPGIFAGATGGDFGGLPPVPGEVTARVPELAIRLSAIAGGIDATLALDADKFAWLAQDALETASRKLHAVADAIAAEAGDQ